MAFKIGSSAADKGFTHTLYLAATDTTARTYKLRMGSSSATDLFVNRNDAGSLFGTLPKASLPIKEILP